MMTRREKLLVKPWQERTYNNHRRKVKSALPAIDNSPPTTREHVCYKLKKKQTESERIACIERENFRLLQRMGSIMRINRLDNHWITPPPSFLQRVGIYYQPSKDFPALQYDILSESSTPQHLTIRQKHCLACNPQNIKLLQVESTERIPWEQPKIYSRPQSYSLKGTPATQEKMSSRSKRMLAMALQNSMQHAGPSEVTIISPAIIIQTTEFAIGELVSNGDGQISSNFSIQAEELSTSSILRSALDSIIVQDEIAIIADVQDTYDNAVAVSSAVSSESLICQEEEEESNKNKNEGFYLLNEPVSVIDMPQAETHAV